MSKHIVLFSLLLLSFSIFSQDIEKDLYLNHTIKQDGESIHFKVLEKQKKAIFFDKSKFYYWFKAQKVISTQGGASGLLLHGEYESFHENKQLSSKGKFYKGLKNGEWIYWRINGTISKIETWHHGKKKGKETICNDKGVEVSVTKYSRNNYTRQTGDSLIVSNLDNSKQTITIFDKSGNIVSKSKIKNGISTDVTKTQKEKTTSENKSTEKKSFFSKFKKDKTETKESKTKKINWKFWQKKKEDAK